MSKAELRRLVAEVADGFAEHRLLTYASAIAYQVISAIVPFALFALGLMGLLHLQSLWIDHLAPTIADHASGEVSALANKTVTQVLRHRQTFWVTFGLVLVLWELSGAMRATMEALDDVYEARRRRSRRERYTTSVTLAAAVGLLVLVALVIVIGGRTLLGGPASIVIRYALAAVVLAVAVAITLRFAPAVDQPIRWVGAGSAVIVVGWLLVVGGYVLYAGEIASYGSVFGSLAVVFVLIVAVYLSAVVFMVGALIDRRAQRASR